MSPCCTPNVVAAAVAVVVAALGPVVDSSKTLYWKRRGKLEKIAFFSRLDTISHFVVASTQSEMKQRALRL